MASILNYELAPKPGTIFGCLLPAPWLGVVAGLLLAFGPADAFPHRFSPLNLALTHVLALGMLAPIMIGALFQLFPVVAGQSVPMARYIAPFVALGSAVVALGLSIGFLAHDARGFLLAMVVAVVLYGAVILALLRASWRIVVVDATTRTLKYIPLTLALVVGLGVGLAGSLKGVGSINIMHWLNNHVAWALVGWVACLLLGVASTVVPMFWQSARPSVRWHRYIPFILWIPLILLIVPQFYCLALIMGSLVLVGVALIAFLNVSKAKRHFDPAWSLWLVCCLSWFLVALLGIISELDIFSTYTQFIPWWIGVLALVGGAVFPINAMLGKIIPFLVFLHLRRQIPLGIRVPTMQAVLPPQRLKWQARLLILSLFLLISVPFAPASLRIVAGVSFALSQAMMGSLLMMSLFRYRHELRAKLFPK